MKIRILILALWNRYKRASKPFRRRVGLWLGFFVRKLIGRYRFDTLNRICIDLASYGRANAFVRVVRCYDPALPLPKLKASFITGGAASGSLNVFRLFSGSYSAFEKIYRNDASEWARCLFFYEVVLPLLSEPSFKVPRLLKKVSGQRLLLAHFEVVQLELLSKHAHLLLACRVICSLRYQVVSIMPEHQWLNDWQSAPFFTAQVAKTRILLTREGLSLAPMERIMRSAVSAPRFVSHGDLNLSNLGVDHVVDWDCFGYYPAEYDVALIVAHYLDRDGLLSAELECFIAASHSGLDAVVSISEYRSRVYFFSLIMTRAKSRATKIALYDRLFLVSA